MKNKPVVYKFESAIRRCPASTRRRSGVLIVNLIFSILLTIYFTPCSSVSFVNFQHKITGWVVVFWTHSNIFDEDFLPIVSKLYF